ncbi:PhzF family phenazine biosynthesis protein [Radiobacillus kanasensis]|uniref:PhzF family phenazine biosynthesis protein n=1 Tax=Radiobacillus kanasensis TaxID=2844358 RepID=UPI001E4B0244|nr:PhzF family phenazine biosynthesis protein [Radiobacillus kanasensis]UFU00097.1 PhzF family phenazine biosynthesis protein [Radiobacillus kanasensis]
MNLYFINAFTKEEFKGNPAAIVILDKEKEEKWMQQFAKELNQPITTYVMKRKDFFQLRWFTPTKEIDLCGHGTLGASHILWSEGYCDRQFPIEYDTASGKLMAEATVEGIKLSFPVIESSSIELIPRMEKILGIPIKEMAWAKDRYIVEVADEDLVHQVKPNYESMKKLDGSVIVTTSVSEKYDMVSRYFAPQIGVNEDSVTGSAHCALALYWSKKWNKKEFKAYQASERSGELQLSLKEDSVEIIGDCITIIRGKY